MAFTCPECGTTVSESWLALGFETEDENYEKYIRTWGKTPPGETAWELTVDGEWMTCPECTELLVRVKRVLTRPDPESTYLQRKKIELESEAWLAVPRRNKRRVDQLVPDSMKRDYLEAAEILDASPRMSSVLSRRILADMLEIYAGINEYTLAKRIDKFIEDDKYPSNHKDNLHVLREMGNFSAHTAKDKETGDIIEVTREEAEWTLDVVDGLFDFFIIAPERDKERRANIAEKLKRAERKPIRGLEDDGTINP